MLLVDTNVLVDVLEDDPQWADWSIGQLRAQSKIHRLAINPIIYSELSLTFSTIEALDQTIDDLGLTMVELPRPAVSGHGVLTRDTRRYASYFPSVVLVAPRSEA